MKKKNFFYNDSNSNWGANDSAVQICAAVTAYGRIAMNKFKNITNNVYLGGDTDSIIMSKPIPSKFTGDALGLFKLKYIIIEAFLYAKKAYMLVTIDNKQIIKFRGISRANTLLKYDNFVSIYKGEDYIVKQVRFKKDIKNLTVKITNQNFTIKGLINKDINYRFNNRKLTLYNPRDF